MTRTSTSVRQPQKKQPRLFGGAGCCGGAGYCGDPGCCGGGGYCGGAGCCGGAGYCGGVGCFGGTGRCGGTFGGVSMSSPGNLGPTGRLWLAVLSHTRSGRIRSRARKRVSPGQLPATLPQRPPLFGGAPVPPARHCTFPRRSREPLFCSAVSCRSFVRFSARRRGFHLDPRAGPALRCGDPARVVPS
jgi:hypothetical protein